MKIKRWLIISYILVILSPIIIGSLLFGWIREYSKDIALETYLKNTKSFSSYQERLDNPKFYIDSRKEYNILKEDEGDDAEIRLYNKYGHNIYSSGIESLDYILDKQTLYKDLYDIRLGYNSDTLKKPVFQDGEIVGFYEITLNKKDFIKGINRRTIIAIGLFILNFILVLFIVIKMINKKIDNPLKLLILSMKSFAAGENIKLDYKSKDEIGELILQFNQMKDQIEEKNFNLEREKSSKEYMISAISHDLKTPLTSIRAYAEIIRNNQAFKENGDTKRYEDIIIQKCDYMKDMLEDLHLYTLLTSDYEMDFVEVEGEELFQMILSGYKEMCLQNNLSYLEQIKINGSYLLDVKSTIRLMDNLITNAIKYGEEDSEVFVGIYSKEYPLPNDLDENIRREIEDLRGEDTVIIVQNTGVTISKDELENILEPFYKADNSRKSKEKGGTGLGLSIVKRIVERHKGGLKLISRDNTTTIIYTIKREDD